MDKIVDIKQAVLVSEKLKKHNKAIVLVGGCFDILHQGHIKFLEKAKKQGDFLFVLLESDEKITKIKGKNRPINQQRRRAEVLSKLKFVDFIITLPFFKADKDYDHLVFELKPDIIATTKGDPARFHKERQAKVLKIKVVDVIKRIPNQSTTRLINNLSL